MKLHTITTISLIMCATVIGMVSIVFALYQLTDTHPAFVFSQNKGYDSPAVIAPFQVPLQPISASSSIKTQNTPVVLPSSNTPSPSSLVWDVPFTSQAPNANWDEPYQNFCEEAAALMAAFWARNKTFLSKNHQEKELNAIKDWEITEFGDYIDTDAEQTARILTDFFDITHVQVIKDPTLSDIKSIIKKGGIVIAPTAGKMLNNPNFRGTGPLYHMLVIRGYNEKTTEFITNDPGTRKGEKYPYSYSILDKSIANWYSNGRTIRLDDRQIIAVYKE